MFNSWFIFKGLSCASPRDDEEVQIRLLDNDEEVEGAHYEIKTKEI